MVELLPQHLIIPGLSTTEQVTKAPKELIHIINNPGPKNSFTTREIQFHAIDRLLTLFQKMQPQQPNTKFLPRKFPKVVPTMMPIKVPSPRVPMTVAPPRVIEPTI